MKSTPRSRLGAAPTQETIAPPEPADIAGANHSLRMQETVAPPEPADIADDNHALRMQETVAPPEPADISDDDHSVRVQPTTAQSKPADPISADVRRQRTVLPNEIANTAPASLMEARSEDRPRTSEADIHIGKYQLIRELGRGGMGSVHLARDTRLGRLVAIKFLTVDSRSLSQRFIAEARTTAQCNHENIVVLYEADEYEGQPYMVLEYLQGRSLAQLLNEQRTVNGGDNGGHNGGDHGTRQILSVPRAVELMIPVLHALERAHNMGIVHRDLKPDNIMLTDSGSIKVLDFGIAKVLADAAEPCDHDGQIATEGLGAGKHRTQGLIGTIPYMSPEQLAGTPVDARSDIWAVGIMLYELLTGGHPMGVLTTHKLERIARLDVPMPRVTELRPDLGGLGAVIDRCLIKSVTDRISSARTLLRELDVFAPSRAGLSANADDNPFAGLSAFQESDADRFFGRTSDIANLVARVRSQPLVTVIGPSGVGKSSLIRAGVIPALKRSGDGWESLVIRPGRKPIEALATVLEQLRAHTTSDRARTTLSENAKPSSYLPTEEVESRAALCDHIQSEPGYLGTELRAWAKRKLRRLILFVDQFEELYTAGANAAEREAFLACLASVADDASSPLRVLLTMRSDFLDRMAGDRAFMTAATRSLILLSPMDRDGLREALEKPLLANRYRFEAPGMVDKMLDELQDTAGALPLLQFTASQLWTARDRTARLITEASYQAMGGIAGTLARHADQVLAGMPTLQRKLARAIFERLVTPERTRAIVDLDELRLLSGDSGNISDIEDVLQALAEARLVTVELSEEQALDKSNASIRKSAHTASSHSTGTVEIIHESLIARWPRLHRWLDENQDDAAMLSRLRTAAREWHKSSRSEGFLWSGEVAAEARHWDNHFTGALGQRERQYLDAVFAHADRYQRRKRNAVMAIVGLLSTLLVAAVIAMVQIQGARAAAEAAEEQAKAGEQRAQAAEHMAKERQARAEAAEALANEQRAQIAEALAKLEQSVAAERQARAEALDNAQKAQDQAARARAAQDAEVAAIRRERAKAREAEAAEKTAAQAKAAKAQTDTKLKRERRKSLGNINAELE